MIEINDIDISIAVRLEDVIYKYGFFPNINDFKPFPIDNVLFGQAVEAIRTGGKIPIRVHIPATPYKKGKVVDSIIDIRRNYFTKGSFGSGNPIEIVQNGAKFDKVRHQDLACNIEYELRFICNTEYNHLAIDKIIMEAFGFRTWIQAYDSNRDKIEGCGFEFASFGTPTDLKDPDRVERMYRFMAKDLFVYEPEILHAGIKPINTIGIDLVIKKDTETDNESTDNDLIEFEIVTD
jgi:hypothetical protein